MFNEKSFQDPCSNKAKNSSNAGECLVVVLAIPRLLPYLYGIEFLLVRNHGPLKFATRIDKLRGKLAT